MDTNEIIKNKAERNLKILPCAIGISMDLLFYIAVETLFYTTIKGFSASQISFLLTISGICFILLRKPLVSLAKKIGNTNAVRVGVMMLLTSSILITFAPFYFLIAIGHILYTVSFLLISMNKIILKNNLKVLEKSDEYIKYSTKGTTIYSIITAIIALISGPLFNINPYLPMYCCIAFCIINVIFSIFISDVDPQYLEQNNTEIKKNANEKFKFSSLLIIICICYGLFFAIFKIGHSNSHIFIQAQLKQYFSLSKTSLYFSYIMFASRITRIFANILFRYLYKFLTNKLSFILPFLVVISFSITTISSFLPQATIKIICMGLGLCLLLSTRDMYETFIQDLVLKNVPIKDQQQAMSYLGFSFRLFQIFFGFIVSLLLIKLEVIHIIFILIIIMLICTILGINLYGKIIKKNDK